MTSRLILPLIRNGVAIVETGSMLHLFLMCYVTEFLQRITHFIWMLSADLLLEIHGSSGLDVSTSNHRIEPHYFKELMLYMTLLVTVKVAGG